MYIFNNINIADYVIKNNSNPIDETRLKQIPPERWKELLFDIEIAEDMCYINEHYSTKEEMLKFKPAHSLQYFFSGIKNKNMTYATLDTLLKKQNSNHVAILIAHGGSPIRNPENWQYADYPSPVNDLPLRRVQEWIDERSASNNPKYGLLIIDSCNEGQAVPLFKGTPIAYATGSIRQTSNELEILQKTQNDEVLNFPFFNSKIKLITK